MSVRTAVATPLVVAAAVGMMGAKASCGAEGGAAPATRPTIATFEGGVEQVIKVKLPPGWEWKPAGRVGYGNRKGTRIWKPVKVK